MQTLIRFSFLCTSLVTLSLVLIPTIANAQHESTFATLERVYGNGYDDGYDDGYEDAMEDCPCPPLLAALNGFYGGVNLGYNFIGSDNKVFFDDQQIAKNESRATGWAASVLGGYGKVFPNRFYLGGELYLGTTNAEGTNTVDLFGTMAKVEFSANTTYGLTIMPGYKLPSGPLVYLRLGANKTEFETQAWTSGLLTTNFSETSWEKGYSLGIGIETDISKQFGVRLDYDHINYNSINNSAGGFSTKIEPTDDRMSLGLVYNFLRF